MRATLFAFLLLAGLVVVPAASAEDSSGGDWNVPDGQVNAFGATVLNNGHIDLASRIDGGTLTTSVKDTTMSTEVWRDPAKTIIQALPSSAVQVPANPSYAFLGSAGSQVWLLPQTQQSGLLWPGWSTQAIPKSATTAGVGWSLRDVSGPGAFILYDFSDTVQGGVDVLMNSRDGITSADQFTIPKDVHAHGSWAFTAEGHYCLSFERAAELPGGQRVYNQFVLAAAVGTAGVTDFDPASCNGKVDTTPGRTTVPTPTPSADAHSAPATSSPTKKAKKAKKSTRSGKNAKTAKHTDSPSRQSRPPSSNPVCTTAVRVLSSGHIDYSTRIVNGALQSSIGDDTTGTGKVYRDPDDVVLWLKPAAKIAIPAGFDQIAPAGSTVWQVPQTQNPALIWVGWNTQLLTPQVSSVRWRIDSIDGPGTVKVYTLGSFGGVEQVVLSGAGSTYQIPVGVHAHANWAFSREGIYLLKMTQTATLGNGRTSSDTQIVRFAVGDVDLLKAAPVKPGCTEVAQSGVGSTSAASGTPAGSDASAVPVAAPTAAAPVLGTPTSVPVAAGAAPTVVEPTLRTTSAGTALTVGPVQLLSLALGGLLTLAACMAALMWWTARRIDLAFARSR